MNLLQVDLLPVDGASLTLTEAACMLDRCARHPIAVAPWPAFPDQPAASFSIAHYNTGIAISYFVQEKSIRAVNTQINGPVWQDSCVEFFIGFEPGGSYYNIEFNCTGTGRVGYGPGRNNRALLPAETVATIHTLAQISRHPQHGISWELTLLIPVEVFMYDAVGLLSGQTCTANFYKCGDLLPQPHFLAWSAIASPLPDFHVPAGFGVLRFQ